MITLDQAKQYLASIGVAIPDFVLQLILDRFAIVMPCLEEHYDPATISLILLYTIGLFGVVQGDRLVTSQSAPSGASQSYRYGTVTERYKGQLGPLQGLDTYGCTDTLIPPLPGANAGMWLGQGGCDPCRK